MGHKPSILQPNKKLYAAAEAGNVEEVNDCLEKGGNPNYAGEEGTPLHRAAHNGHVDVIRALVAGGADVNAGPKKFERTPLHEACMRGKLEAVKELIAKGADPDAKDAAGKSCQEVAVAADHGLGTSIT